MTQNPRTKQCRYEIWAITFTEDGGERRVHLNLTIAPLSVNIWINLIGCEESSASGWPVCWFLACIWSWRQLERESERERKKDRLQGGKAEKQQHSWEVPGSLTYMLTILAIIPGKKEQWLRDPNCPFHVSLFYSPSCFPRCEINRQGCRDDFAWNHQLGCFLGLIENMERKQASEKQN